MADYISKNDVLNLIMHNDKVCHYADERYENVVYATACRISDVVANMPAADVQPIKHGRWCKRMSTPDSFKCSVCGNNHEYFTTYCPNCGARMDGDTVC